MGGSTRKNDSRQSRERGSEVPVGESVEELGLEELRREMEEIDREIVENIARRTYIAETIAYVKSEEGLETYDPDREKAVMDRVVEKAEKLDLDPETVRGVFRLLIEMNKKEQREFRD